MKREEITPSIVGKVVKRNGIVAKVVKVYSNLFNHVSSTNIKAETEDGKTYIWSFVEKTLYEGKKIVGVELVHDSLKEVTFA